MGIRKDHLILQANQEPPEEMMQSQWTQTPQRMKVPTIKELELSSKRWLDL